MPALQSDADVHREAVEALTRDARVDASRISVRVSNGVVTLQGSVNSPLERRVAGEIVRRINGVRELRNELRISAGVARPDEEIAAEIRESLGRTPDVDAGEIATHVRGGVVTLGGVVSGYPSRSAAEAAAWSVSGVVEVVNQLAIVPSMNRTDAEIAHEVRTDLGENVDLRTQQIQVVVRGGVVHLSGVVTSLESKLLAEEVAWWTTGVRDVVNELTVEPPSLPTEQ